MGDLSNTRPLRAVTAFNRALSIQTVTDRAIETGKLPIEVMLDVMRRPPLTKRPNETDRAFALRERADHALRLRAAEMAAPYIHPKIATPADPNAPPPSETQGVNVRELARELCFALMLAERRPEAVIDVPVLREVNDAPK